MRLSWLVMMAPVLGLGVVLVSTFPQSGCYISPSPDAGARCETDPCGCYATTHMVFTGQVMDNLTGQCLRSKLVRLKDTNGATPAEDTSRSAGTYRVEGDVQRSPNCVGGEPVIHDDPAPGATFPEYGYLPRRGTQNGNTQQVDLLRVPFGSADAGTTAPVMCIPPPAPDAG